MMQSTRRKPFQIGGSKGVTLPQGMTIGGDVTMAASGRLLLMDTTGEIPEDKLLQFFIDYVEPAFQSWNQSPKHTINPPGGFRAMQQEKPPVAIPVKPLEPEGVANPQPDVPLVSCFRCGQLIAWTLDARASAVCPKCGAILRLVAFAPAGDTP
jgi:hypothetical protein